MKNLNAFLFSEAKDTRLYVIEHSVIIEETLSITLGTLLNIEWEKSKSLGIGSSSLSFSQKAFLIQDIKDVPKSIKKGLEVFMVIRNKFAHVKSISTFEEFTNSSKDRLKLMNQLLKKHEQHLVEDNLENKYKYCIYALTYEIFFFLFELIGSHVYTTEGEKQLSKRNNEFIDLLKNKITDSSEASTIWKEAIDEMNERIKKQTK